MATPLVNSGSYNNLILTETTLGGNTIFPANATVDIKGLGRGIIATTAF